jgi:hypothetical protein
MGDKESGRSRIYHILELRGLHTGGYNFALALCMTIEIPEGLLEQINRHHNLY